MLAVEMEPSFERQPMRRVDEHWHFAPGDAQDLAAKVRWAADHPAEMRDMGANARREYESKYTPEVNFNLLMAIYEDVIRQSPPVP